MAGRHADPGAARQRGPGGDRRVAYGDFNWAVLATFLLAAWVLLAGVRDIFDKTRHKGLIKGLPSLTRSYWGMQIAHLGIAVCALGVVLSSQNSAERDLRLAPGESMDLAGYHFIFEGAKHFEGPNFTSDKGTIRVVRDGKEVACCTRKNACTPCRAR
jgi:cytochrome c-type biogenesis protein CcmF